MYGSTYSDLQSVSNVQKSLGTRILIHPKLQPHCHTTVVYNVGSRGNSNNLIAFYS